MIDERYKDATMDEMELSVLKHRSINTSDDWDAFG